MLIVIWLALDLYTKSWAVQHLKNTGKVIDILPVLRLYYVENHGAAFGMLSDQGGWQRYFFLLIVLLAGFVLLRLILMLPHHQHLLLFSYASIFAGAIGNGYDRVVDGYVRDMISVYYEPIGFYFAVFNVADIAVCIGAIGMVFDLFFNKKEKDKPV